MTKHLPFGRSAYDTDEATVSYWAGKGETELFDVQIGTAEWFAWLEQISSFRMIYVAKGPAESVRFTVRSELRKNKRRYWQAWKTVKGKTIKKYVGPTAKLTKKRLDEAGQWLYEQVQAGQEPDPEERLVAANEKLVDLVEELIAYCSNPELVEYARNELEKLREVVA